MLRIVTAPFHPDLELALVEEVRRLKDADPLAPLAIIVPSDPLRHRLKWLLCAEHGCALLDVHFLTFYQLAIRLLEETDAESAGESPPSVQPEFFFKEFIHHLLRRHADEWPAWSGLVEMPGGWAALWATLKDLKDAGVEADRAAEFLSQVGRETELGGREGLEPLLVLYRAFLFERDRLGVADQDDLAALARDRAAASDFLNRQRRVLYYGFYDLTQVQLELFQAVARAYPTTLYFPLVKGHPAFLFGQRFFERYVHGMITQEADWHQAPPAQPEAGRSLSRLFTDHRADLVMPRPACRIMSTSGPVDEVTAVAKEILGLVEERGYAFHDIGVVARTLTGYERILPRVFDQHGIPFSSTVGRPLLVFPYIKAAIQLLELRVSGFRRDQVMDLLLSPYANLARLCPADVGPRPDLWDLASRRLGITKGMEEWRRLTAFLDDGLPLREHEDGQGTGPRIPAQQIRAAWMAVSTLAELLDALAEHAGWDEYATQTRVLCRELLVPPAGVTTPAQGDGPEGLDEALEAGLQGLASLSRIGGEVPLADFVAAFRRLMEETSLPIGSVKGAGVRVLDAMAARGVSFRALFLLGLNEKVFPRHIHEDAFLRDRTRRLFEVDLGFKIQEKLAGYDEEKLLFYLLCNAASDTLILLYQRTDEGGRLQVPSGYLDEVKRVLADGAELAVPRRLTRKFEQGLPHRIERLTPSELGVKLLLERRVPRRLLEIVHPAGGLVDRGLVALRALEQANAKLGGHDGVTGALEPFWQSVKARGVSPTSLEEYATCPFRYFARQVLRLDPLTVPESVDQIGPPELGTLAHEILRTCLQTLRDQGYFTDSSKQTLDPFGILEQTARQVFERFARTHPVGYPLVWELHQETLLGFLREVLREDLDELKTGWEPVLFEETVAGILPVAHVEGPESVPLSGRLDRVDWSSARNAYRVVDYKFKASCEPETLDKNLKLGAVRGLRLQPPLYLLMAQATVPSLVDSAKKATPVCEGVEFYYLAPKWAEETGQALTRVSFPGDAWDSGFRQPLERGLSQVIAGIRSGLFFIYPDGYCERCEYRLVCRRTHQPTVWRARTDHRVVSPHRQLRRARLSDENGEAPRGKAPARRTPRGQAGRPPRKST